ncbi:cupin domain-containing protein [Candidatus Methanoperedens nitroreducens]|uniref:Cupin domain-containing protein n=1 Tax=Candidatus Methanoperedens nitratireducens TaxID=1392998 RepID=A0A062VAX7_9EURY|nr:cupin domain-containing protein [Candidatus Methanoperedens nitroreducens]KCZ73673.1 cupin domain-containing protein [Candidatus Methanoperedens nitroreducens]MDJ1422367.1 cupin domain-containing protein [Candidatus Methanoperedens sp.]
MVNMSKRAIITIAMVFLATGLIGGYLIPRPVDTGEIQPQLINVEDRYRQPFENRFGFQAEFTTVASVPTGSVQLFRFDEIDSNQHPDENHFLYFLEGRATGNIGGVQSDIGPGTLLIVPADVPYSFRKVGDEPVNFILFSSPPFE